MIFHLKPGQRVQVRKQMSPSAWPKREFLWQENDTLFVSVPFTWRMPAVRAMLLERSLLWRRAVVGGPAVRLMPDYLTGLPQVQVALGDLPGVLQRINPLATRTTWGCPNECDFCGVRRTEPGFGEYDDWPDLPIICDNNLTAASRTHFERVIERLARWGWADFNQGLDATLLTDWHADQLARIPKAIVRLSLDDMSQADVWAQAVERLIAAGIARCRIRTYVLVGYDAGPKEAWDRCRFVESKGVDPYPMWYHDLTALVYNQVTRSQRILDWAEMDRKALFQWYYQHRTSEGRYSRSIPPDADMEAPDGHS